MSQVRPNKFNQKHIYILKTTFNRNPSRIVLSVFLLAAALCPASLLALGIRIADQDAAATARGDAFVATADNPSAVYYNPAGLTQLKGNNLLLGTYGITYGTHFNGDHLNAGTSINSRQEITALPQLYYTYTAPKQTIAFGLGIYSPYGLSMDWPGNVPFGSLGYKGEIDYLTVNPVVAIKPTKTLSIAVGPTFNFGTANIGANKIGGGTLHFRGNDNGVIGLNAGILWHPLKKHSFGISYHSATRMNFSGQEQFPLTGLNGPSTAAFNFPQNIVFGYSYRPTPKWNLEVNADWTDWSRLNAVNISTHTATVFQFPLYWEPSWFYEFGVTRYLNHGWSVSGGYIYSENSVPNNYFKPIVPDSDRHIFSLGVGKAYKSVSWNAAYQLAYGPSRSVFNTSVAEASANGSYSFLSHAVTFDLGFHF